MTYSFQRITFGNIADIDEVALIGSVELAQAQPEIQMIGNAKFEQRIIEKKRIRLITPAKNDDVPFKYLGKVATIDEFLERVDNYLLAKGQYLAQVRELCQADRIFGHSICGILYTLK